MLSVSWSIDAQHTVRAHGDVVALQLLDIGGLVAELSEYRRRVLAKGRRRQPDPEVTLAHGKRQPWLLEGPLVCQVDLEEVTAFVEVSLVDEVHWRIHGRVRNRGVAQKSDQVREGEPL